MTTDHPSQKRDRTARAKVHSRKLRPVTSLDRLVVLANQRRSVYVIGAFGLKPAAFLVSLQGRLLHDMFGRGLVLEYPAGKKTRAVRQPDGLMQETRPCSQCRHFSAQVGAYAGNVCTRKWMSVTPDLKVTFKLYDGSCFQSKRHPRRALCGLASGDRVVAAP